MRLDLLQPGTAVGAYQVIRPLSAGGNAQVFVAWDPTLQREVALKVLSGASMADPDSLQRIQREARVLAQLSHPNILQVLDLVKWEDQPVVVTELLEGRTLRALLAEGPLPPARAVDLALQVASALAVVHGKGIIHRDIKPENLFLTTEGRIKVLDFGLAKNLDAAEGQALEATFHTTAGLLQGTVGYLSPEQIGGHPVDGRSDLYALGLVLWELLKGRPPGQGRTALERQIQLLKDGPGSLGSGFPAGLEALLHRCLAVDPADRIADAEAFLGALEALRPGSGAAGEPPARPPRSWRALGAAGLLLGGGALGALAWSRLHARGDLPTFRRLTFQKGNILRARFGPGGNSVFAGTAFEGQAPGVVQIALEGGEVRALGLNGADILAVSRTGELALLVKDRFRGSTFGSGTLARVMPGQDAPRLVLDEVTGADWDPEGRELAVTRRLPDGTFALEYPVGRELHRSATPLGAPRFSPDGSRLAFMGTAPLFTLFVREADGTIRTLLDQVQASDPFLAWGPGGRELVFAGNTRPDWMPPILAVDLSGRVRALARFPLRALLHDVAPDGRILFEREVFRLEMMLSDGQGTRDCTWLDGSQVAAVDAARGRVLFSEIFEAVGQRPEVHLRELARPTPVRLGFGTAQDLSADGAWALALMEGPQRGLRCFPTGKGVTREVPLTAWTPLEARFRPGHDEALVLARNGEGRTALLQVNLTTRALTVMPGEPAVSLAPSPDGQRVALLLRKGRLVLLDLATAQVRDLGEVPSGRELLGWAPEGTGLLLADPGRWPVQVERHPFEGGGLLAYRQVGEAGAAPPTRVDRLRMSPDGRAFGWSLLRITQSDLMLAEGVAAP